MNYFLKHYLLTDIWQESASINPMLMVIYLLLVNSHINSFM